MRSFFFGEGHSLYGTYHPPAAQATGVEHAVVICPSIASEYMRSYRAIWQVAEDLAQHNAHVLRFDYYATGESVGRQNDGDWSRWCADVLAACRWLGDETALASVRIVGHRLGALIACNALATRPAPAGPDVEAVTLWDPVVSGADWTEALLRLHAQFASRRNRFRRRGHQYPETETDEYLGFHIPEGVMDRIRSAALGEDVLGAVDVRWALAVSDPVQLSDAWLDVMAPHDPDVDELKPCGHWGSIADAKRRLIIKPSIAVLRELILG